MKHLLFVFALQFMVVLPNLSQITSAISNGDAVQLSKYFDSDIEIEILGEEGVYSKGDATNVVKSFFSAHKPNSFKKVHEGRSKGKDGQYSIGSLKSGANEYRVYIYTKIQDGKGIIQELRIYEE